MHAQASLLGGTQLAKVVAAAQAQGLLAAGGAGDTQLPHATQVGVCECMRVWLVLPCAGVPGESQSWHRAVIAKLLRSIESAAVVLWCCAFVCVIDRCSGVSSSDAVVFGFWSEEELCHHSMNCCRMCAGPQGAAARGGGSGRRAS